jgi:hypothetical protein
MLMHAADAVAGKTTVFLSDVSRRMNLRRPSFADRQEWDVVRREMLSVLAQVVTGPARSERLGAYSTLVDERATYTDGGVWRHAVAEQLPFVETLPADEMYSYFCRTLDAQVQGSRTELFYDIQLYDSLLYRLGGAQCVVGAMKAVSEVARWWA